MEIRHLSPADDRLAISRIYEESWKYAYKGIVPQDFLEPDAFTKRSAFQLQTTI